MNGGIKDEALTQGVKFVGIDKVIQYPPACKPSNQKYFSIYKRRQKTTIDIKYDYKVDSTKAAKCTRNLGISLRKISKVDG